MDKRAWMRRIDRPAVAQSSWLVLMSLLALALSWAPVARALPPEPTPSLVLAAAEASAEAPVSGRAAAVAEPIVGQTAYFHDLAKVYDFGDAPTSAQSGFASSYPTTLADSGARHVIVSGGPSLNSGAPDDEADGQAAAGATGDDDNGTDDEDGVNLPPLVPGSQAVIGLSTNGNGYLNAWVDYNSDGDWDDLDERIAADVSLPGGASDLPINVPMNAQSGLTYARFRFSSQQGLAPTGQARDGEVEDHEVTITDPLPGAIGDLVWYDADGDGIQDVGEPGIPNITLDLYYQGDVVATTVTDADGGYLFPGLPPGSYAVDVTDLNHRLDGLTHSVGNQSQPEPTPEFYLDTGAVYRDADLGYTLDPANGEAVIGDTTWYDDNGDNIRQPGEPGIPGVTIVIRDPNGNIIGSAITDDNGRYLIEAPLGSGYAAEVDEGASSAALAGFTRTGPAPVYLPPLTDGQQYLNADFGYDDATQNLLGEVGDRVWLDTYQNDAFDSGETLLPGVSVDLIRDSNGNEAWDAGEPIIATVTSSAASDAGNYLFTGVPAGSYLVHVSDTNAVLIDSYRTIAADQSSDDTSKDDPYPVLLAGPGDSAVEADFGYYPTPDAYVGVIGNQVWIEGDRITSAPDGIFDPLQGDTGQPGVTVDLLDQNGNYLATATTGASGNYIFVHLSAGAYQVQVWDDYAVLGNYSVTALGPNPSQDNNNQQQPYTVTPSASGYNLTADFGYTRLGGESAASYTVIKRLNGDRPVRVGQGTSFTASITNTSDAAWITYLPLRDEHDATHLGYLRSEPASPDSVNGGLINWRDLTETFGPIAPGRTVSITVSFTALKDTYALPNGVTLNTANVHNVWADADGPDGPEASALSLPEKSSTDGVSIYNPTGVGLAGFTATAGHGGIALAWETATELDIAGFLLLRRTADGDCLPINSELLVAQHPGADQGAVYTFLDPDAPAGLLTYILQVMRLDGRVDPLAQIEVAQWAHGTPQTLLSSPSAPPGVFRPGT